MSHVFKYIFCFGKGELHINVPLLILQVLSSRYLFSNYKNFAFLRSVHNENPAKTLEDFEICENNNQN